MKIVKNILIKCINTYATHFSFPNRGMGFFLRMLFFFDIQKELFKKKCNSGLFCFANAEDHIQKIILWQGEYEKEVYDFAKKILLKGNTVLDIGSNIGYHSIHFASLVPNGKVYCFEPNSLLKSLIKNNFQLNNLDNFKIVESAVSDKNIVSDFLISDLSNTGLSVLTNKKSHSTIEVKTVSLDYYFKDQPIHLIKIDIEGSEMLAVQGMKNILTHQKPYLVIEIIEEQLNKFNTTCSAIYEFLFEMQYQAYQKIGNKYVKITNLKTEGYSIFFIHTDHSKHFQSLLNK